MIKPGATDQEILTCMHDMIEESLRLTRNLERKVQLLEEQLQTRELQVIMSIQKQMSDEFESKEQAELKSKALTTHFKLIWIAIVASCATIVSILSFWEKIR